MSYKNYFSFLLLAFAVLLFDAGVASACSCVESETVLEAYEDANVVVIAKAVAVEKSEGAAAYRGISSTRMIVEKVFKGNLKIGDEMTFAQGGGGDCILTFDERSIDKQFLFYLAPRAKNSKLWVGWVCGRSRGLPYAADDLLYLNKLDKVRGKTRISGTIEFEGGDALSVEGRKIRITGANKTYELKTDRNGVYEIYDLPAGKYLVEPEVPAGWKIDNFWLGYSPSFAGDKEEDTAPKRIPIDLENKKHAALDIRYEIDNAIRGKVFDPHGKPMKDVCIAAVKAQNEKNERTDFDCTEEDGAFAITEVPPGSYLLVINDDGKISTSEPFGTFYYPNVFEREKAAIITIGAGDMLDGLNIYAPQMEEVITIEGVLLYSDGKPVVDEGVQFEPEKTQANVDGDGSIKTDANGRFSIKVLKGLKGKLFGRMFTYSGEFENCPKLEAILKKTRNGIEDIKTSAIEIQAERDLYDVELKYPFPGCKKAK